MKKYFQIATVASFMLAQSLRVATRASVFPIHRGASTLGSSIPDLSRLTVKELRSMATQMKIKGRSKARRKADLVKIIEKAGAL